MLMHSMVFWGSFNLFPWKYTLIHWPLNFEHPDFQWSSQDSQYIILKVDHNAVTSSSSTYMCIPTAWMNNILKHMTHISICLFSPIYFYFHFWCFYTNGKFRWRYTQILRMCFFNHLFEYCIIDCILVKIIFGCIAKIIRYIVFC